MAEPDLAVLIWFCCAGLAWLESLAWLTWTGWADLAWLGWPWLGGLT